MSSSREYMVGGNVQKSLSEHIFEQIGEAFGH